MSFKLKKLVIILIQSLLMTTFKEISLFIGLCVIATLGTSCSPKTQKDCGFVQNVYGQRISWKEQDNIKLIIHSSVPIELRAALFRAAQTWENEIGRKLFEFSEDSTQLGSKPSRDQKNGVYFLEEWESDRSSEQGRTSVYWVGDKIQEADIRINASNFSYYDQDVKNVIGAFGAKKLGRETKEAYNFEALALHELGHLLGLKHRKGSTVMATHLSSFSDRTQLSSEDKNAVSCEYK